MPHIYKRLDKKQAVTILRQYQLREITAQEARMKLGLGKTQFFALYKRYASDENTFELSIASDHARHRIGDEAEERILSALKDEKKLIENKAIPIKHYNYSAVRDFLREKHKLSVSVSTIISRAKEHGFYLPRPERKAHTRIVETSFAGELVQHDSSHHLWSPYMTEKLYLITSLDDYSRLLLYAELCTEETAWRHIEALQGVCTEFGCPLKYYADQHSIFRYVKDRDTERNWHHYMKFTDDVLTQWRIALSTCKVDVAYALSPQAKGKIERPYRWMQDRIVRTAAKEKLNTLSELREVVRNLKDAYNNRWVHSTTHEIPRLRFENAVENGLCLFRPLPSVVPHIDIADIFCLRAQRKTDGYKRVSFDSLTFELKNAEPCRDTELHLTPDATSGTARIRFFQDRRFVEEKRVKLSMLKTVRF